MSTAQVVTDMSARSFRTMAPSKTLVSNSGFHLNLKPSLLLLKQILFLLWVFVLKLARAAWSQAFPSIQPLLKHRSLITIAIKLRFSLTWGAQIHGSSILSFCFTTVIFV